MLSPATHIQLPLAPVAPIVVKELTAYFPNAEEKGKITEISEKKAVKVIETIVVDDSSPASTQAESSTTKRVAEGEGLPEKKKPKRAGLTHLGPIC